MSERCEGCGFEWDVIAAVQVAPGIVDATHAIAGRVRDAGPAAARRPAPDRWSAVEYAAHVRDVLLNVRDRIIQTLVEDEPTYAMLWRDERVDRGLYAGDTAEQVADEVEFAGSLFARTFDRIDGAGLERTGVYAFPVAVPRTVRWIGAQALHEARHHLADIDESLAARA